MRTVTSQFVPLHTQYFVKAAVLPSVALEQGINVTFSVQCRGDQAIVWSRTYIRPLNGPNYHAGYRP